MELKFHKLMTLALAVATAALMVAAALYQSTDQLRFGPAKLAALAAGAMALAWLRFSWRRPRWMEVNTLAVIVTIAALLSLEIGVRVLLVRLPAGFVALLPPAALQVLASRTGQFSTATIEGEGIAHHYRPFLTFPEQPWVTIDRFGFRNAVTYQPGRLDMLLVGDSMVFARDSRRDLGDHLRAAGFSVYNAGMPGSSLVHYASNVRKLKNAGYRFDTVVIGVCMDNDFEDTLAATEAMQRGDDWTRLLGGTKEIENPWFPWAPVLVKNAVLYLKDRFLDHPELHADEQIAIRTPWGEHFVDMRFTAPDHYPPESAGWKSFQSAFADLVAAAHEAGAGKIVVTIYPEGLVLFEKLAADHQDAVAQAAAYNRDLSARIARLAADNGATVLDLSEDLSAMVASGQRGVTTEAGLDYHLSDHGVDAVLDRLRPLLQRGN
ncbi:SGNH/GDSL hydrolase family protein [Magnetospirillum aberrantis]|uniref:SGNH/GDSL hydrolase family protein n=1 Tax=Magnetospirillum aberrantis SpK TaxID=908842 RepID=A0A7C9UY67_9PROT|nr:SGNH/GDSL hydrolase family protein [Magnetospirillum aberrantis]NFV81550.1 hypothetical protein [Magnetospirillum aberrantis SpK]